MLFQKWRNQLFLSFCSLIIKSLEWYSTLPGALYKCLLETKRIELYIKNSAYLVRNYSGLVTTLSPRCNFTFQAQCILQKLAIQCTRYKWNQGNIWKWQLSGSEKVGEPWESEGSPDWVLTSWLVPGLLFGFCIYFWATWILCPCIHMYVAAGILGGSLTAVDLAQRAVYWSGAPRSPGTLAISPRAVKCSHREFTRASTETNALIRERLWEHSWTR